MFARCVSFSFTAFLLSLFPVAALSATKEGAVAFDIKTLEGLGYSAELANFLVNRINFYPVSMMSLSLLMPIKPIMLQLPSTVKVICVWIVTYSLH